MSISSILTKVCFFFQAEDGIRDCFSVRDFTEMAPNIFLKRSTFRSEANVEFFQLAGEVGAKLADRLFQCIRALVPCWAWAAVRICKINSAESVLIRD